MGNASTELLSERLRTQALLALRDRYAAGEADLDDFSAGVDAVLAATTRDELRAVVAEEAPAARVPLREAALFDEHLGAEEELLWVGRPSGAVRLEPQDRVLLPLAGTWLAIAVLFEAGAVILGWAPAVVFTTAILLVSLYGAFGRLMRRARRDRRTRYALTTRHVIRVEETRRGGTRVDAALLSTLPAVSVRARRTGLGDVDFPEGRAGAGPLQPTSQHPLALCGIADAVAVGHLIRSVQAHAAAAQLTPPR